MLSCAGLLTACSSTVTAGKGDGAGYALMTPLPDTRSYIFRNDPGFTRELGAHNEQCRKDPMCKK